MKKYVNYILYSIFAALIWSSIPVYSSAAVAPFTYTIDSKNNPGYLKYSSEFVRDFNVNVPQYANMEVKTWTISKNGISKGKIGTYDSSTKKLSFSLNGDLVDLKASGESHMYHALWRDSSGTRWSTGTTDLGTFVFPANPSTFVNGISNWPGLFPEKDETGKTIPPQLRFSDGSAAAWSDRLAPPDTFYYTDSSGKDISVGSSYVIPSTVTITSAKARQAGADIDYYGKGKDGYGYIKAHMALTGTNNNPNLDYEVDNSLGGNIQGRKYFIDSDTDWSAQTYILEYEITVTYESTKTGGSAIIRHVDKNGAAIPGMPDREEELELDKAFSSSAATAPTGYKYAGYVKTTTGNPPTKSQISNPTSGEYSGIPKYDGSFDTLYLYYVYDADITRETGQMHVRHMVRTGASGSFVKAAETTLPVTPLPKSQTVDADPSYGTILGKSQSTTAYSDTVASGSSVTMYLTTVTKEAYVTFFYEKAASFTADFDVIPDEIEYKESFTLHPKDFELNGCTYISHKWRIVRGSSEFVSSTINGMNTDTTYTWTSYPSVIGVGTHSVYMKIKTSCGESEWIGPKELAVTGPSNNRPPQFQIAWVRPSEPLKPVYQALEGEVLNLVVIQDPTVPTPIDPDGDTMSFDGFDFSSDDWLKTVPSKGTLGWMSYNYITMDGLGLHNVQATMRDQFGATSTASTYILVVPPAPIPVIDGPTKVVEGRPLPSSFNADGSYSPIPGRCIDHSRDEWTNVKPIYMTPGQEIIQLHVYDCIGLKSVEPARHVLTVLEDMPPVVELKGALTVVRGIPFPYTVNAVSPDGDKIVSKTVSIRYDSNNNGSFTDEAAISIALDSNSKFDRTYAKVGKYQYTICATEDWGKSACITVIVNAVNDAPEVSFDVSSTITEPPLISVQQIKASDVVYTGSWRNSDGPNQFKPKAWTANADGSLTAVPYNVGAYSTYRSINSAYSITSGYSYSDGTINSLGDEYYAENEYNGAYKIHVARKGAYGILFTRQYGSFNGFNWTQEWVYNVDLFNRTVVTQVRSNTGVKKYAYYSLDSFINAAGQPYKLEDTLGINNLSVPGFDLSSGEDAGGSYIIKYPWGSSNGQKIYTNCIMALTCHYSTSDLSDNSTTYYGNYTVLESRPADNSTGNLYIVDERNNYSRVLSSQIQSIYWVTSMDERYVLYKGQRADQGWRIHDTVTGTITPAPAVDWSSGNLVGRWNDYIILGEMYGSTLRAYKFTGGTVTYLWSSTNKLLPSITNDGKMYGSTTLGNNDIQIQSVDIKTGAVSNIAYLGTGGQGSVDVTNIRQTSANELQVDVYSWGSGHYMTYWIKGNSIADNQPLGTQNQLIAYQNIDNIQLQYSMQFNDFETDQVGAGFSYRMQSDLSYYSVEQTAKKLLLVKVRNGWREIIGSADFAVDKFAWNTYKIIVQDDRHRIYVNGVPMIDVRDGEFRGGSFGPYASLPKTMFKGMSFADLSVTGTTTEYHNVAIVSDSNVKYNDTYQDPENDPAIKPLTKWYYNQFRDPFLDAGDGKSGLSALNGKTYTTPQIPFDKVGVYRVKYSTTDDPNPTFAYPNTTFTEYRQNSNEYVAEVIVHRRPIANFTVEAMWDGTVRWTDYSYDPDRYLSPWNYSIEPTGIDYYKTHGILEKKFYYITPSGVMVREKLVTPQEIGMYEIGMAVRDEYGAWSAYYIQNLNIGVIGKNNTPPTPGFTSSYINTFRNVPITFNSYAYDNEDGGRENLSHEYYIRNLTLTNGSESLQSTSRTSWTKTFNTMGTFNVRQVVEDSLGAPAQFELQVTIHNQLPSANIVTPSSADQNNPTKFTTLRPTIHWTYGDWDGDPQTQYQLRIYRYGGILQADTNTRAGADLSFTPNADLPEKVYMYAVVRVYDGYDWGDWSAPKFFYIETNRPPVADFDWTPKPVWEKDTINLTNLSSDPDGDTLTNQWTIVDPAGNTSTSTLVNPTIPNALPGTYTVTLTVTDPKGLTDTVTKQIVVNANVLTMNITHIQKWIDYYRDNSLDLSQFMAGEPFNVTATTSSNARSVTVSFAFGNATLPVPKEFLYDPNDDQYPSFSYLFSLQSSNRTSWRTEAWRKYWIQIPDGTYTATVTATYDNGSTSSKNFAIVIKDHIWYNKKEGNSNSG